MASDETPRDQFPPTRWTLVLQAREADPARAALALEEICARYWYPIYAFLRSRGNSPADAEDLTQIFFQHLLARDTLAAADPDKGKLRSFLLAVLKQVAATEFRDRKAQKRGGDVTLLSFDTATAERRYALESAASAGAHDDPTRLFDAAWAREVLDRAWTALRAFYEKKNRSALLAALEPFVGWHEADGDYRAIAQKFGITEGSIRLHVHRMRQRLRRFLEEEVLHTLADPADLDAELRHLLALAGS